MQWIVLWFTGYDAWNELRFVGRLLIREWFPWSFHTIAFLGALAYIAYLECNFCKKQKKGES